MCLFEKLDELQLEMHLIKKMISDNIIDQLIPHEDTEKEDSSNV